VHNSVSTVVLRSMYNQGVVCARNRRLPQKGNTDSDSWPKKSDSWELRLRLLTSAICFQLMGLLARTCTGALPLDPAGRLPSLSSPKLFVLPPLLRCNCM